MSEWRGKTFAEVVESVKSNADAVYSGTMNETIDGNAARRAELLSMVVDYRDIVREMMEEVESLNSSVAAYKVANEANAKADMFCVERGQTVMRRAIDGMLAELKKEATSTSD